MIFDCRLTSRSILLRSMILLLALGVTAAAANPPIVQPGAPGQPSRQISAEEALDLARVRHTAADVRFMSDMVPHHQQALDMAELVTERTGRNELIELARRIESSQKDEIEFMLGWLRERGEPLPERDWRAHVMPAMTAIITTTIMLTTAWKAWPRPSRWPSWPRLAARRSTDCFSN